MTLQDFFTDKAVMYLTATSINDAFDKFDALRLNRQKKEAPTMKVTYNGFTGELVKLERDSYDKPNYSVSIFNTETGVEASFSGIALEDVKFRGGVVTFGE